MRWRASFVLKSAVFVKRLRPISIIFSSSPVAKARRDSLPALWIHSAAS